MKEWKHIRRAICWSCEHLLDFEPIQDISIRPNYINVTAEQAEQEDRDKAVAALVVMGWTRTLAQSFVDKQEYCTNFINKVTTKACEEL
jgi:hypothetical protein